MLALIITILIQIGIINSEQQFYNASPQQQQEYIEIVDDDMTSF
jgi:hypothetical protein